MRQRAFDRGISALLCLTATLASAATQAESVYVIDELVVNVTSNPGGEGDSVGTVKSGDPLEVLERQNEEAHIRLPNGAEGWIKASYLSADQPLQQRLTERTAEVEKLKQDVSRLQSELATARTAPPAPVSSTPEPANSALSAGKSSAAAPAPAEFPSPPEPPSRPLWQWLAGTSVVMLLAGFALGWRTLDRRIRSKFGGLRIY
jgi:hypothetical protein